MTPNRYNVFFIVVAFAVSLMLFVMAWYGWPMLDGDASAYLPPMVAYAKGDGLVNSVWASVSRFDVTGQGRLIYHGFLYQLVVGSLAHPATYPAVFKIIGGIQAMALLICAFSFFKISWLFGHRFALKECIVCSAGLLGVATALLGLIERPEPFAILLLAIVVALLFVVPRRINWLVVGIGLGCLLTTHPAGAVMAGCAALVFGNCLYKPQSLFIWLMLTGLVGGLTLLLLFRWYPYGFKDWLVGCQIHSAYALGTWKASKLYYWFLSPHSTFLGGVCLMAGIVAAHLIVHFTKRIANKTGLLISIGLLLLTAYYFGGRVAARNYNIQLFIPVLAGLIIAGATSIPSFASMRKIAGKTVVIAAIATLTLSGAGFIRACCLFPFFLKDGMPLKEARIRLEQLRNQTNGTMFLDHGLFALTENYSGISFDPNSTCQLALVQQANTGRLTPPDDEVGLKLIESHFSPASPRLFGFKISNTLQGYNFALYSRPASQQGGTPGER